MSRPGYVGPVAVEPETAMALSAWIAQYLQQVVSAHADAVDEDAQFGGPLLEHHAALASFRRKLERACRRRRRNSRELPKLWTVTRDEAVGLYRFLGLLVHRYVAGELPLASPVFCGACVVISALESALHRGRPARTYTDLKRLLERYRGATSAERPAIAGGTAISEARSLFAFAETQKPYAEGFLAFVRHEFAELVSAGDLEMSVESWMNDALIQVAVDGQLWRD